MMSSPSSTSDLETTLEKSVTVYKLYEDLLNSYVSDYYQEEHWSKLPKCWGDFFKNAPQGSLQNLLDYSQPSRNVYPLSLLSLKCFLKGNVLPRRQQKDTHANVEIRDSFTKLLWKNVKLKKRHEITILAETCYQTALKTSCFCIVDVGAGLGHLSRMLAFKYGFKVCTIEGDATLSATATQMDDNFKKELERKRVLHKKVSPIIHINMRITNDITSGKFCSLIKNKLLGDSTHFGLIGLHPCGNLATTLLRLYNECPNVAFINMVSCCYMKLTYPSLHSGFPLSKYCSANNFELTYLACEIACHAIENYVIKLNDPDEYRKLKIHSYRAILEKILVTQRSNLKHSIVSSVKYRNDLSLEEYCEKHLSKYGIVIDDYLKYEELVYNSWEDVIIFYSLRLLMAPLVESIILYDRMLYLREKGSIVHIESAFDCTISPRNHIIVAYKNKQL